MVIFLNAHVLSFSRIQFLFCYFATYFKITCIISLRQDSLLIAWLTLNLAWYWVRIPQNPISLLGAHTYSDPKLIDKMTSMSQLICIRSIFCFYYISRIKATFTYARTRIQTRQKSILPNFSVGADIYIIYRPTRHEYDIQQNYIST